MAETGHIETNGARLYSEAEGDGDPLLLIHGGLGSLRMWDGVVPALAARYRVLRYDTRGWGRSETEDVEFRDHDDAAAVLDHFGVESAFVVGQSRGGMFALDLALDRPERVRALVSVAGGIGGFQPEIPESERPPWDEMERLWEAKDWEALSELETKTWVDGWGQPEDRVDPEIRRTVKGWIEDAYRAEKPWGKPQKLEPPAVERLDQLQAPLLVLIGQADEPGGVVAERHLSAAVSGARVVEFPNVAHMIQLEEPERFTQVVLDFLAECSTT